MNDPPEGSEWDQYEDVSTDPSYQYSRRDQTGYMDSEQPAWETPNYEPPPPQTNDSTYDEGSSYAEWVPRISPPATPRQSTSRNNRERRANHTTRKEYSCNTCGTPFKSRNERDRHYQTVHVDNGERSYRCEVAGCPAGVTSWRSSEGLRKHNKTWHGRSCDVPGCWRGYPHGFNSQEALEAHREAAHRDMPRSEYQDASTTSSTSNSTVGVPNYGMASSLSGANSAYTSSPGVVPSYSYQADSATNVSSQPPPANPPEPPDSSSPATNIIKGSGLMEEILDSRFKVQPSSFFVPGKVFKILWTEPSIRSDNDTSDEERTMFRVAHGEKVYSKIRRFVVIRTFKGHSQCLSIYTYGGKGLLKKGVVAEHHTKIFIKEVERRTGVEREEEQLWSRRPIRIRPDQPSERLDPMSRLNYAKVYTVEHNVKVLSVGRVTTACEKILIQDFDDIHRPLSDIWGRSKGSQQTQAQARYGYSEQPYDPSQEYMVPAEEGIYESLGNTPEEDTHYYHQGNNREEEPNHEPLANPPEGEFGYDEVNPAEGYETQKISPNPYDRYAASYQTSNNSSYYPGWPDIRSNPFAGLSRRPKTSHDRDRGRDRE